MLLAYITLKSEFHFPEFSKVKNKVLIEYTYQLERDDYELIQIDNLAKGKIINQIGIGATLDYNIIRKHFIKWDDGHMIRSLWPWPSFQKATEKCCGYCSNSNNIDIV